MESVLEEVRTLVGTLRTASYTQREPLKERLIALSAGAVGAQVRDLLESMKRGELLEVQWEIEEVIDATAPKAAAPPPPAPVEPPKAEEPEDPNRPLTSKDLVMIYDDPRGLVLHKTKTGGDRWFATQFDPQTRQPQTFELHPEEIAQLKQTLAGSPHWVLGSGVITAPAAALGRPPGR